MKYSFKLSPIGKQVAEWHLSNYRQEKQNYEREKRELISTPIQHYGGLQTRSRTPTRTTENHALDIITAPYLRRMEVGINAVERTLQECDQTDRELVDLVYFKKTHSIEGAGVATHLSKSAAYKRINAILACVAYELGYYKIEGRK